MNKLGDADSLDRFTSNLRVEPVAGPMGRNQNRLSSNRFDPMRSIRVVHMGNGQAVHVRNGFVVRRSDVQLVRDLSGSPIHIEVETPGSESDDDSNQSMGRRTYNCMIHKLNRTKKRLNFEKDC